MPEIETSIPLLFVVFLLSYLIGAIPFGLLVARLYRLGDIRSIGSGNIGATNVLRTGNRAAALFTLLGDAGKGALCVLLAAYFIGADAAVLAGLASFLGHIFSCFTSFQGGKGVATFFGIIFALSWPMGVIAALVWLGIVGIFRISALGGIMAPLAALLFAELYYETYSYLLVAISGLVLWRHKENIKRIISGRETKVFEKRSESDL